MMEENKNNKQIKDVPLDELRARYLGKSHSVSYSYSDDDEEVSEDEVSGDDISSLSEEKVASTELNDENENTESADTEEINSESESEQKDTAPKDIPIEELRSMYLKRSRSSTYKQRRTGLRLAKDIIVLVTVILMSILMCVSFATPTTKIGGEAHNEKTKNIFGFIWRDNDSIWEQLKDNADSIADLEDLENIDSESDATAIAGGAIASLITLFRMFVMGVASLSVLISIVINFIKAIYHFYKHNSAKLGNTLASLLSQSLIIYIIFAFFGGISGGSGPSAYFVGYSAGIGMTVAMILGLAVLIFAVISTYILNRKKVKNKKKKNKDSFDKWIAALCGGICCALIGVVLTTTNMYSVISYVLSSSLSTALLSILNGFDFKALLFPLFNLGLIISAIVIYNRAKAGFNNSFKYLMFYGDKEGRRSLNSKEVNYLTKKSAISFIPTIVCAVLAVIFVFCLRIPSIGYGWSVDIYNQFVWIFAFAALGQTAIFAFSNKKENEIDKTDKKTVVEDDEEVKAEETV